MDRHVRRSRRRHPPGRPDRPPPDELATIRRHGASVTCLLAIKRCSGGCRPAERDQPLGPGATLPVRFWNCHSGSARMVPNFLPRADASRSMAASERGGNGREHNEIIALKGKRRNLLAGRARIAQKSWYEPHSNTRRCPLSRSISYPTQLLVPDMDKALSTPGRRRYVVPKLRRA